MSKARKHVNQNGFRSLVNGFMVLRGPPIPISAATLELKILTYNLDLSKICRSVDLIFNLQVHSTYFVHKSQKLVMLDSKLHLKFLTQPLKQISRFVFARCSATKRLYGPLCMSFNFLSRLSVRKRL